jgi:hypothetical protein
MTISYTIFLGRGTYRVVIERNAIINYHFLSYLSRPIRDICFNLRLQLVYTVFSARSTSRIIKLFLGEWRCMSSADLARLVSRTRHQRPAAVTMKHLDEHSFHFLGFVRPPHHVTPRRTKSSLHISLCGLLDQRVA